MKFNKKGAGDAASFVYALLAFGIILAGSLSLTTTFMGDRSVTIPDNFTTLADMTGENSVLMNQTDEWGNEISTDDTEDTGLWQDIKDTLEDSMLGKAFKAIKLLGNSFKVVSEFTGVVGSIVGIPPWMAGYIMGFFGVMLLVVMAYFFRGIQRS